MKSVTSTSCFLCFEAGVFFLELELPLEGKIWLSLAAIFLGDKTDCIPVGYSSTG